MIADNCYLNEGNVVEVLVDDFELRKKVAHGIHTL
jgi:hypothetical protein